MWREAWKSLLCLNWSGDFKACRSMQSKEYNACGNKPELHTKLNKNIGRGNIHQRESRFTSSPLREKLEFKLMARRKKRRRPRSKLIILFVFKVTEKARSRRTVYGQPQRLQSKDRSKLYAARLRELLGMYFTSH